MNNDLISRSALIKWIDDSVSQFGGTYSTDMLNMWGLFKDYLINKAPTVEKKPQKGKWLEGEFYCDTYEGFETWGVFNVCSECGEESKKTTNYCSNCGVKMETNNDQ